MHASAGADQEPEPPESVAIGERRAADLIALALEAVGRGDQAAEAAPAEEEEAPAEEEEAARHRMHLDAEASEAVDGARQDDRCGNCCNSACVAPHARAPVPHVTT